MPRISVVLSVYNGEPFLEEAIASILNQTDPNFELIIIDDGSKDQSWDTLTRFAKNDQRIHLSRNLTNRGVVCALNQGLEMAKGEFIVRQDADDISLPQRIEKQVDFLEANPDYGVIATVPQLIDSQGNFIRNNPYTATDNDDIQQKLLDNMCICGPSITIRREAIEAAGYYFSEGLDASEDYDLCLRLAEVTRIGSLEEKLYLYRQHPNSASRKRDQMQMFHKAIALERAIYRRHGSHPDTKNFYYAARDYLHAAVLGVLHQDIPAAQRSLDCALSIYPALLKKDEPCEKLVRPYTPANIEAALFFTKTIFQDVLPNTRQMSRLKSRLISDLYMREVFTGAKQDDLTKVRQHLWLGIQSNPSWLLNRGVMKFLLQSYISRLKG